MPRIPYRTKLRLKKLMQVILILLGIICLGAVLVLVYADSLILYDRDGAHLVGQAVLPEESTVVLEERPQVLNPVIVLQETVAETVSVKELGGVYISTKMLKDIEEVSALMEQITEPCVVFMELKSVFGNFYYNSGVAFGNYPEGVDVGAVDALIAKLLQRGFYLVASVPAFSDRAYVLENEENSLMKNSGYSWMDSRGCYWLDPAKDASLSRLTQIARDLGNKGFREVCFTEFCFPEGEGYVYASELSTEQVIRNGVEKVTSLMAGSEVLVSFAVDRIDFPMECGNGRVYVTDVDGSQAERYAEHYGGISSVEEVVFLTSSKDERFGEYGLISPLMAE